MFARNIIVTTVMAVLLTTVGVVRSVTVSSARTYSPGRGPDLEQIHADRVRYNRSGLIPYAAGGLVQQEYIPNEIIVKFGPGTASDVAEQVARGTAARDLRLSGSLDVLNRRYKVRAVRPVFKGFKEKQRQFKQLPTKDRNRLTATEKRILRRLKRAPKNAKVPALDRIYKLTVELKPGQSLEEAVTSYNDSPGVEYAHVNHIHTLYTTPNDSLYSIQWPLNNTGQSYPGGSGTSDSDIDAPEAWDVSTGSGDIVVAVIDTGVDYGHRDLDDNMWTDANGYHGYDFSDDDTDPNDYHGHGTHCAGVIAAEGNNSNDIAGVNWDANIMAVKVFPLSTDEVCSNGIRYAADNGADVLSNSWGPPFRQASNPTVEAAVDYARALGCVVVFAAGNDSDDVAHYSPANYSKTIAVAATDSDDDGASFSNYGDLVDLAAPGVDILSLRASGTAMGSVYDDHTTVASGTSMACPHVAGACAFLLSIDSAATPNDVREILVAAVDPIDDGLCYSDGRLNLSEVAKVAQGKGLVRLDTNVYSCSDQIEITLVDTNLRGNSTQDVNVTTSGGDDEVVTLSSAEPNACVFSGSIQTSDETVDTNDGELQLSHGETITVTYYDANDGTGSSASPNDTATGDCQAPVISNIDIDASISIPVVTFESNEPAICAVLCDTNCGEPYAIEANESGFSTSHSIKLKGLDPNTEYFYAIEATDQVANSAVDSNDSQCYKFTTITDLSDINVPGDYNTIQDAIDHSWNGNTIWLADGNYSGQGNYNIDFDGRAITVRSDNGPDECSVDCNMLGRGFIFENGEDPCSVIDGLTIKNGYATSAVTYWGKEGFGGAVACFASNPTIKNSHICDSFALTLGGGLYVYNVNEISVSNCTFSGNKALYGGAITCEGDLSLDGCVISDNETGQAGGGLMCIGDLTINGCEITDNLAGYSQSQAYWAIGGGINVQDGDVNICDSVISRNTLRNNSLQPGGGIYAGGCDLWMENCVVSDNNGVRGGGCGFYLGTFTLTNCTIANNTATHATYGYGGGIMSYPYTTTIVNNCILWGNTAQTADAIYQTSSSESDPSALNVSYSDIEDGQEEVYVGSNSILDWGSGNIDSDPNFAFEDDYHILSVSSCVDAGTNDPCAGLPDSDIDDNDRPLDGDGDSNAIADMGAYEYNSQSPSIALSPPLLQFSCQQDGDDPNDQTLSVRNTGGGTLSWQVSETCSWLDVDPNSGTSTGEADTVTISVDSNGLTAGEYDCELTVNDNNSVNGPRTVPIKLKVRGTLYVPSQYGTIQMAVDAAEDGELIMVADGNYRGNGNRDIRFNGKAITLKSENGPDNCIIDCNASASDPHRGFDFRMTLEDGNSIVEGFTIKNGYVNDDLWAPIMPFNGGGINCENSNPQIRNCIVENCHAALFGGGISLGYYALLQNPTYIEDCTIRSNSAGKYGGGGILVVDNAVIRNTIVTDNSSEGPGGGIVCWIPPTDVEISNCTIVYNSSDANGGGLSVLYNTADNEVNVSNCIFWGNTADVGPQISLSREMPDANSELTVSYSDVEGGQDDVNVCDDCILNWGNGNIDSDPCFLDADSNDYHLVGANSPCFNAGDPNGDYGGQVDIDGDNRVMDSNVDMGADEISCMAYDHPDYYDWVEWGKPDCWCYLRQCRGDADGQKEENLYWVYDLDLAILSAAFAQTEENMPEGGICADFAHDIQYGVFRVYSSDLSIFQQYYEEEDPNVPECGDTDMNFWVEP